MLDVETTLEDRINALNIPGCVPTKLLLERRAQMGDFWERCKTEAPKLYTDHMHDLAQQAQWDEESRIYDATPEGIAAHAQFQQWWEENKEEEEVWFQQTAKEWGLYDQLYGRKDALAMLGIAANSKPTPRIIKNAYRRLARQHHPDRGGDLETMKRLNAAYHLLTK